MSQPFHPVINGSQYDISKPSREQNNKSDLAENSENTAQERKGLSGSAVLRQASISVEQSISIQSEVHPDTGQMILEGQVRTRMSASISVVQQGPAPTPSADDDGSFFEPESVARRLAEFTESLFQRNQESESTDEGDEYTEEPEQSDQSSERGRFFEQIQEQIQKGFEKARELIGEGMDQTIRERFEQTESALDRFLEVFDDQEEFLARINGELPGTDRPAEADSVQELIELISEQNQRSAEVPEELPDSLFG